MKNRLLYLALAACAGAAPLLFSAVPTLAQNAPLPVPPMKMNLPFLHPLFTDGAVLQRDRAVPVWGYAAPGETVSVQIDAARAVTARADAAGLWMARIGPFAAGGPHTLSVRGATAAENITRRNILFGDVWLCSGQSNMEFGIGMTNNAAVEIAAANYPSIRLFTVPKVTATTPQRSVDSHWLECNSTNIAAGGWNGFSAVAYFFGRKLNQELKIPIGLIHSSWGGTEAEAWVSESALGTMPDFVPAIEAARRSAANAGVSIEAQMAAWMKANDPIYDDSWISSPVNDADWKPIPMTGNWEGSGIAELRDFDGVVLFRREIEVPATWAGHDLTLSLGAIDDADVTYWNGAQIGTTAAWDTQRHYTIPGAQVKAGRNLIAVRVTDTGQGGGFSGPAAALKLSLDDNTGLPLTQDWKFRVSLSAAQLATMPVALDANNPHRVDVLYNGMIAPLTPFALKGAIWYQGESNAARPEQYGRLLPTLIRDWRARFGAPLPFQIVQLAGFMAPDDAPSSNGWQQLRAAQMHTAQTVENTGIAITTDIGDEKDIHPRDKQDVGLRLALSALAQDYGQKIEYSGPVVKTVKADDAGLTITFSHAGGGLSLQGDALRVFAVAGADGKWFWAAPQIEGDRVTLRSPLVSKPLYARYAWSNLPRATLYNGAKLPAPPFSTAP